MNRSLSFGPRMVALPLLYAFFSISAHSQAPPKIQASAARQIDVLRGIKTSRSATQTKIQSRLFLALQKQRGDERLNALPDFRFVRPDADGSILVDVMSTTPVAVKPIISQIEALGGHVLHFSSRYRSLRARVPLDTIESLAAMAEVRRVKLAEKPYTHKINTSEGDLTHRALDARNAFGVSGTGVKICALSDGVDSLASLQGSGDLPAVVDVLPGQAGSGDEGSAMLEIIHDLAPGAQLGFATADPDAATFAQNIQDLRTSGCDIIADDIIYFSESPFQDNDIAEAVNLVTADGALYFSSAGNEGNVDDGTSGTWEGDYVQSALAPPGPLAGEKLCDFGDGGQSDLVTANADVVTLYWTDVFGTSANDYDVYDMDGGLTTIFDASTDTQDGVGGDDFPVEVSGPAFSGERIVVDQFAGLARMLHLESFRGGMELATSGCTHGHSAAVDAFSVAAAPAHDGIAPGEPNGPFPNAFDTSQLTETFTCDGPRRIFFDNAGNLLPGAPAGDFSTTGGVVRQKPDITAADGVLVATPGFSPFFGTSAAAPHAAAIAGLVMQAFPAFTPAQIRTALLGSAFDIEAPGVDSDTGDGIVMAFETLQANGATPVATLTQETPVPTEIAGDGDAFIEPGEDWQLSIPLTNIGAVDATAISATLTSSTPGIVVSVADSAYPDIAASATAPNTTPYIFSVLTSSCIVKADFTLTVNYTGGGAGSSPATFTFSLGIGGPGTPMVTSYTGSPVPIPDSPGANTPGPLASAPLDVSNVNGNIFDINFSIDGTVCSTAVSSTTVGIDHTFVNDLQIDLKSPAGTIQTVSNRIDGGGNNYCQTELDDESAGPSIQSVGTANAPFTGSFTPANPLSVFDGEAGDGTWNLQVTDFFIGDTGNIRAFSLTITPQVCDAPALTTTITATKTVAGVFSEGGAITYTVTLTNTGTGLQPDNAGDEFTDVLPAGLTLNGASSSSGTVQTASNTVTWNGPIFVGTPVMISIDATINAGTAGTNISNQGTLAFDANRDGTNEAAGVTDDPNTPAVDDPTVFGVPTPTPTPTATATSTPTQTPTPQPACMRSDGCFTWELLTLDLSVSGEIGFEWRLTNNCGADLQRADFRFVPGATVLGADNDPYSAPVSGRNYTIDIVTGPHAGVGFVPNGAALASGQSELFDFRIDSSTLDPTAVLWNNASTATFTGRMDIRQGLCFQLQQPIQNAAACYRDVGGGNWDIQVHWDVTRTTQGDGFRLFRLQADAPGQPVAVGSGVLQPDADGHVSFGERQAAGSVVGYRVQPVDRAGAPSGGSVDIALGPCGPSIGLSSEGRLLWILLALLLIPTLVLRARRSVGKT